jgi:hypothetical protein
MPRLECCVDICPAFADEIAQHSRKANQVLAALAEIAFADISEAFDSEGRILPFDEIPIHTRRAIADYKVRCRTRTRTKRNGEKVIETVESVSIRFHSKLAALAALGRYLGMFEKPNHLHRHWSHVQATAEVASPR